MSLIHEALEKVGREKKDPSLPGAAIPGTKEKVRPKENLRVIYGIVVTSVFCFVLGIIYFLSGSSSREKLVEAPTPALAPARQDRFALTGITRAGTDWNAIINNRLVRVGDGVSGARVVRIGEEEVVLDERGETTTLELYGNGTAPLRRLEKTETE